jgi:release factor glutamine methyltransferase
VDEDGRLLYPLPFPDIVCEPGVFVPTVGSLLLWRHLWRERPGEGRRCLDVGCGTGLLTVQLALDGAEHVHAVDIDRLAVANTLANAFRNGVSERVSGGEVDLYTFEPEERYDVVVASLYQMPVDPFEEATHRPPDFWGRNLLDHLLGLLPRLLAEDGRAFLLQVSILSQVRTAELAEANGLETRVVDVGFFPMSELFLSNREQIARVEQLSDAWHLELGETDVMAAYLLELTRRPEPPT